MEHMHFFLEQLLLACVHNVYKHQCVNVYMCTGVSVWAGILATTFTASIYLLKLRFRLETLLKLERMPLLRMTFFVFILFLFCF